jgi:hypothetical protein
VEESAKPPDKGADLSREEAFKRGEALVASFKGYDKALEGTTWFGVYFERKNIGRYKEVVSRAPGGTVGAYSFRWEGGYTFFGEKIEGKAKVIMDQHFALVSLDSENLKKGEKVTTKVRKQEGVWRCEKTVTRPDLEAPIRRIYRWKADGKGYWPEIAASLILRKTGPREPGYILLPGLDWPAEDSKQKGQPSNENPIDLGNEIRKDFRIEFLRAVPHEHRGRKLTAFLIRAGYRRRVAGSMIYVVDGEMRLLSMWNEEIRLHVRLHLIAGEEAQTCRDLDASRKAAAGADSPKAAVIIYLEATTGQRQVDDLDTVVDWKALLEAFNKENHGMGPAEPGVFAEFMKSKIRQERDVEIERERKILAEMKDRLLVKVEGGNATVRIPDPYKPMRVELKKTKGGWKIVALSPDKK